MSISDVFRLISPSGKSIINLFMMGHYLFLTHNPPLSLSIVLFSIIFSPPHTLRPSFHLPFFYCFLPSFSQSSLIFSHVNSQVLQSLFPPAVTFSSFLVDSFAFHPSFFISGCFSSPSIALCFCLH